MAGDGATGDLLDLFVEHLHRWLGLDDVVADEHADRKQRPAQGAAAQAAAQQIAYGREPDVDTGEEQNQPDNGIHKAQHHTHQLARLEAAGQRLEQHKHAHDGQRALQHLGRIMGQVLQKGQCHILGSDDRGQLHGVINRLRGVVEDAQQHDHQDGANTAQSDEAEAVVGAVLIAAGS